MHLRPLKEEADPSRRPNICVIEELSDCGTCRIDRSSSRGQSKEGINQQTADDRVNDHFQRVLVKRRYDFNALGAVVNLVKGGPQDIVFVPPSMPPVKHESSDEVTCDSPKNRRGMRA